jgi:hypothetical protein
MSAVAVATSVTGKQLLAHERAERASVVVLSSSLLVDRMLIYTDFLDVLQESVDTRVWATSAQNLAYRKLWLSTPAAIEDFPKIDGFREFPHNYFRRLNEYVWDFRKSPPSRLSMMRHVRNRQQSASIRALKLPAKVLAKLKLEEKLEHRLEEMLLKYERSPEGLEALRRSKPAVLLTTGPFQFEQPAIVANARRLKIPTLGLIPSWDNISTKGRMPVRCDGYVVWSEQAKSELHDYYPFSRNLPVYIVGAPQFDVFFRERFKQTRETFCAQSDLRSDLPIIVYAVGSPNFLRGEHYGALRLAERIVRGDLGDVQMIVRPHPIHDNEEMVEMFRPFAPRVVVQRTAKAGTSLTARSQDERQVTEWVNTFRHADVVVNLSSTVTIDAAIFDRPIVNLDYDPTPGAPNQELIKDINHHWTHFKPVAESGGLWLVNNEAELLEAVRTYLRQPEKHRAARQKMVEYVCGYTDGQCGKRMAEAVVDFMSKRSQHSESNVK